MAIPLNLSVTVHLADATGGGDHEGGEDVVIDPEAAAVIDDHLTVAHLKLQLITKAILLKPPLQ